MKKLNKRDFDMFGVLIGVLIGLLIGYFIGGSNDIPLNKEDDNSLNTMIDYESEFVYLLRIGSFKEPDEANNFYKEVDNKNIDSVYVKDNDYYFIYVMISSSESEVIKAKEAFSIIGYDGVIVRESLYDRLNYTLEDNNKYLFYNEMIKCLISSLNNEEIIISDESLNNPSDIELVSWVNMLKSIQNESYKGKLELQTYKMIIEKIK